MTYLENNYVKSIIFGAIIFVVFGCSIFEAIIIDNEPQYPSAPSPSTSSSSFEFQCKPLPKPKEKTITVRNIDELYTALNNANGPLTIFLENGVYRVSSSKFIQIKKNNITIRSKSGKASDVIIKGSGMNGSATCHGFLISGKKVTIADLTIRDMRNHGIQIAGEKDADNCKIHNVHFIDINEQMIKVSKAKTAGAFADNGIVQCSVFKFSKSYANQYYTGGIDAHRSNHWLVQNNIFENIRSPENRLAEHAIHFWGGSKNITVRNNRIINCDRGIGFGFGLGTGRYGSGGKIMNNMIHTVRDVGISLEDADNVKIYNNTLHTKNYANSIELRFHGSVNNQVINNLMSGIIKKRDGGEANTEKNLSYSRTDLFKIFKNPAKHDYRLTQNATIAIDRGKNLSDVKTDIELERRPKGNSHDIGADEF